MRNTDENVCIPHERCSFMLGQVCCGYEGIYSNDITNQSFVQPSESRYGLKRYSNKQSILCFFLGGIKHCAGCFRLRPYGLRRPLLRSNGLSVARHAKPVRAKRGGAKRDRTADLYNAIVALSQLSYSPMTYLYNDSCTNIQGKTGFLFEVFVYLYCIKFFHLHERVISHGDS